MSQLESVLDYVTFRQCKAYINRLGKPDTKSSWSAKKISLTTCGKQQQVAVQNDRSSKDFRNMDTSYSYYIETWIHHTVATQAMHHQTKVHLLLLQQLRQQQQKQQTTTITLTSMLPPTPVSDQARWVKILFNKPLTEAKVSLLARTPNFTVVALYSLKESVALQWSKLALNSPRAAEEPKAETCRVFKCHCHLIL